jgi:squalene-associated FAD-dependent desaturase
MNRVAVVGGGWAGLAAAVELAAHGEKVTVLEAARQLGGRARSVPWDGIRVDNGQHLFVGAYRETLRLMERVGSAHRLERRPLDLRVPAFRLRLPTLPAPWHLALGLLAAHGLGVGDKLRAAAFMQALKRQGFRLDRDLPAADLLARHRQSERLVDRLWAPICVAALNTPLEQASAQVFCNVLRDSLAGERADSDLLLNRGELDNLFPGPAAEFVRLAGGEVRRSCAVTAISRPGAGFHLAGADLDADRVILAVHPARLPALLTDLPELADVIRQVETYAWQPILTLWLRFAAPVALPFTMLGLGGGQSPWAFARDDLAPGLVAVVVSAEGPHLRRDPDALKKDYLALLAEAVGPLPPLLAWKRIVEKRATYACAPDLPRPDNATPLPGLYLAGDYTRGDYPATIESAVRSGVQCARLILEKS